VSKDLHYLLKLIKFEKRLILVENLIQWLSNDVKYSNLKTEVQILIGVIQGITVWKMKECNCKELKAGDITGSYIIMEDFFIALSKYLIITNKDLTRIEKYDFVPLYYADESTIPGQTYESTESADIVPKPDEQSHAVPESEQHEHDPAMVQTAESAEQGLENGIPEDHTAVSGSFGVLKEAEKTIYEPGLHEGGSAESEEEIRVEEEVYGSAVTLTGDLFSQIGKNENITIKQIYRISLLIINYISNLQNDALTHVGRGYDEKRLAVHSVNTAILTAITAVNLKLRGQELVDTVSGALMHDSGILFLKEHAREEEIKKHTLLGYGYLRKKIQHPLLIKPALEHHEKAKGNGYPHRITLEKIGLSSRIVAVCDSYDNQLSFIKFGSDISIHYSKDEFLNWNREDYDIRALSALIDSVKEFAGKGGIVSLNDGSTARVVKTMLRFPLNPIVRLESDNKETDLRRTRNLWIDKRMC